MLQTMSKPDFMRTGLSPWTGMELSGDGAAGIALRQAGSVALSVSHINGCLVIGQPRTDVTALRPQPLSSREKEVLALVAEGNGNKEIAVTLSISERTVKNHLTGIMTKLRASDRTHAVVTAVRLGWLAI